MKTAAGILAAFLLALGGWLHATDYAPIVLSLVDRTVAASGYQTNVDADDFRLLFCGTGSPNRTPERGQPCLALVADGKLFLFDAGEGAIAKLHEYRAPVLKLHTVFLTHLHSDHVSGVAETLHNTWLYGRTDRVEVVGPPGTEAFLNGIRDSYRDDLEERNRVLGHENIDADTAFGPAREVRIDDADAHTVYDENGLLIEAFRVDHPDWPHAYGYRVSHRGKVIVVSGDTAVSDGIRTHARGADMLIHEAVKLELMEAIAEGMAKYDGAIPPERFARISSVHTDTLSLADLAQKAGVAHLVMTHLIPALPDTFVANRYFAAGMADRYDGEITLAVDGLWLEP